MNENVPNPWEILVVRIPAWNPEPGSRPVLACLLKLVDRLALASFQVSANQIRVSDRRRSDGISVLPEGGRGLACHRGSHGNIP